MGHKSLIVAVSISILGCSHTGTDWNYIIWPVRGKLTSSYGYRVKKRKFHKGIDIAAPRGTKVKAARYGRVTFSGYIRGYGLSVIISHNRGNLKTLYAHLGKIHVQKNQYVRQGQTIGLVGTTGNSTGPHLHFECHNRFNRTLNPLAFL